MFFLLKALQQPRSFNKFYSSYHICRKGIFFRDLVLNQVMIRLCCQIGLLESRTYLCRGKNALRLDQLGKIQHNIPEQMFPAMPIFVSPTVQGVKFLYKAHVVVVVLPAEHKICKMWGFAQNPMHTIYFILLYFRPFNGHGCCSWMCGTILALQQKEQ